MTPSPKNVLVIGASGSIGGAVTVALRERGHQVTCLARSVRTEAQFKASGLAVIRGDITRPEAWIDAVPDFDCVIPVAATWSEEMDQIDENLTVALLEALTTPSADKVLIYTSGCWAYGATGDQIATEETPHKACNGISWSPSIATVVQQHRGVKGLVILPGMVFERDGGVLELMISEVESARRIQIVGSETTRWPLVHREDLAELYCLMMEQGKRGSIYNAASIEGVTTGDIAKHLSQRFGLTNKPEILSIEDAAKSFGLWAPGYAIDQQMSGQKAIDELDWNPTRVDLEKEIGSV